MLAMQHCSLSSLLLLLIALLSSSSLLLRHGGFGCLVVAVEADSGLHSGSHPPPSFDLEVEDTQRGGGEGGGRAHPEAADDGGSGLSDEGEQDEVASSSSSPSSPSHAALLSPRLAACIVKAHPGVVRFLREAATFYPTLDVHWTGTVPRLQLFTSEQHRRDNIVDPDKESEEDIMDRLLHPHSTTTQHHTPHTHSLPLPM